MRPRVKRDHCRICPGRHRARPHAHADAYDRPCMLWGTPRTKAHASVQAMHGDIVGGARGAAFSLRPLVRPAPAWASSSARRRSCAVGAPSRRGAARAWMDDGAGGAPASGARSVEFLGLRIQQSMRHTCRHPGCALTCALAGRRGKVGGTLEAIGCVAPRVWSPWHTIWHFCQESAAEEAGVRRSRRMSSGAPRPWGVCRCRAMSMRARRSIGADDGPRRHGSRAWASTELRRAFSTMGHDPSCAWCE